MNNERISGKRSSNPADDMTTCRGCSASFSKFQLNTQGLCQSCTNSPKVQEKLAERANNFYKMMGWKTRKSKPSSKGATNNGSDG